MKNSSETLVCQINAIADFVCQSSLERNELRALANELRDAARRAEAVIAKRAGHPDLEGMFG
jgi:hypothetical protein